MIYYNLKCEVPGSIGPKTIYDKSVIPWEIKSLHVIFDGWLGAEILAVSSCLLVTKELSDFLSGDLNLTGIRGYEDFQLDKSTTFEVLQPNIKMPVFKRMKVESAAFKEDFALTFYNKRFNQLIISEKAKEALENFNLGNSSIQIAEDIGVE